jgi:DNA-binding SARP family transcriptional activator
VLTVAVLGEVEVRRDGELLPVPAGKTTELLVRLALDAGASVRVDTLLEDLWSEATGRNTLQSKVSQLRRALGDKDLVLSSGDAYTLAVEPRCVDAFRVMDLVGESAAARRSADPATALAKANEGLAVFRGEALLDAGDWAAPHRVRLGEVQMGLLEDATAARVDLGSGGDLVGELEALVERFPLREEFWASLVTALYRAGRQADALAAYARVRRLLVEELGVEPGERLRDLEQQVLQQSLDQPGQQAWSVASPGNLPAVTTTMVGREADLDSLASLLTDHRLITVVGPAGVGKTRLAMEAADGVEAPGGVWLVRLEAVDENTDLAQVVAETLHVPGGAQALGERQGPCCSSTTANT